MGPLSRKFLRRCRSKTACRKTYILPGNGIRTSVSNLERSKLLEEIIITSNGNNVGILDVAKK